MTHFPWLIVNLHLMIWVVSSLRPFIIFNVEYFSSVVRIVPTSNSKRRTVKISQRCCVVTVCCWCMRFWWRSVIAEIRQVKVKLEQSRSSKWNLKEFRREIRLEVGKSLLYQEIFHWNWKSSMHLIKLHCSWNGRLRLENSFEDEIKVDFPTSTRNFQVQWKTKC